jgi:hypothetical protein
MKNSLFYVGLMSVLLVSACSTTIPLQSNLSDQTLLMVENKNIKVIVDLVSLVPNGEIEQVYFLKNGSRSSAQKFEYQSETAFRNMWNAYFENKFNSFSKTEMVVKVTLKELYLSEQSATSIGTQLLTGNSKSNVEAVGLFVVEVQNNGETYQNELKVSSSEYQETQSTNYGVFTKKNPMEQRALLLQNTFNRSIIQFDNFIRQILTAED